MACLPSYERACRLERESEEDVERDALPLEALVARELAWHFVAGQLLRASFQAWPAVFWHDTVVAASEQQPFSLLIAQQALASVHRL